MVKKLKILVIGMIIVITVAYTNMSIATSKTDLQNEKTNLNSSISQAQENLEDIKKEKSDTLNQVESLMGKISD